MTAWRLGARRVTRVLMVVGIALVVAWIASVGFLWANETRIVFRNHMTRAGGGFDPSLFTSLAIETADGMTLEAVTVEGPEPAAAASRYWVLFFNGAAGSIHRGRQSTQLLQLHELGYDVFGFDYRGFGRNAGSPSEVGLYADATAAYAYLTRTRGVPPSRIILAGRSLGSAVAVEMATRVPSAGVVLFSPIDSIASMGGRMYPWVPVGVLATNRFDSMAKIDRVRVPLVVVHATNDRFVPLLVGQGLFAKARAPKRMVVTSGGHNGAGFNPIEPLQNALAAFWPPSP